MAYVKTNWVDEVPAETPPHFVITGANSDCTIALKNLPTEGTPVNATNLNKIENELIALETLTKIPVSRRVGEATDWGGTHDGTQIFDVSAVEQKTQVGASIISSGGDLTVTFPVAFSATPIVLVQIVNGLSAWWGVAVASYVTPTNMHLSIWNSNGVRLGGWVNWIAIGPV